MASKDMHLAINILQTYGGRDKVIRCIGYGSLLLSGLVRSPTKSKKLRTIFNELGSCRTILRLFDDLPMLGYSLSYGWGKQEKSLWLRVLGLANNVIDQLYFPLEHIAWAADAKLISISSAPWWVLCMVAWALSLAMNILRSLTLIIGLRKTRRRLEQEIQAEYLDSKPISGEEYASAEGQRLHHLKRAERAQVMELVKNAADLCNAVHWLPAGFLWGGRLSDTAVGFFGTVSSILFFRSVVLQAQARLAV